MSCYSETGHKVTILGSRVTDPEAVARLQIWGYGEKLKLRITDQFAVQGILVEPSELLLGVRIMADDMSEATARVMAAVNSQRGHHRKLWMDEEIPFSLDSEDTDLGRKLAMLMGQIGRVAEHINQAEESLNPKEVLIQLRTRLVEAAAMAVAWAESLPTE